MRNRARNRKQQEKEAERQAAYYADGGPFDNLFAGTIDGHNPDCDVFDRPPEGIVKQCNCGPVTDLHGKPLFTDKSECFVHSAGTAKHNQTLDYAIERASLPLCYLDPCNDPECRLDHADRESK